MDVVLQPLLLLLSLRFIKQVPNILKFIGLLILKNSDFTFFKSSILKIIEPCKYTSFIIQRIEPASGRFFPFLIFNPFFITILIIYSPCTFCHVIIFYHSHDLFLTSKEESNKLQIPITKNNKAMNNKIIKIIYRY